MNLYRSLLWWLALAVLGALAWHWFSQDLGDVVVRFRGLTYTTTLAYFVIGWGLLWFALWALWWLLGLPGRAWRRHAHRLARNRLVSGLEALHQGRWQRAEQLLAKAAGDAELRTPALLGARRAAAARGDAEAVARHHAALLKHDAAAAVLDQAERLLQQGKAEEALSALAGLPTPAPRAQVLRAEALLAAGRAADAQPLLAALRRDQALDTESLAALELRVAAAVLAQAPDAAQLQQRWHALGPKLQQAAPVAAAFARRAGPLGLEDAGAHAVADALDANWDESLAALYGRLPPGREGQRLARAEAWLAAHPSSPGLLATLGSLCREAGLWGKAGDYLHRALAQGAGADAWECLGHVFTSQGEAGQAQLAYANALRVARGEAPLPMGGRGLREQIADQAVAEVRNAHGIPLPPAG